MAAPDYVPVPTDDKARVYTSPPWRPEPWMADRPAELDGRQPRGPRFGSPGPDQGYAMKLATQFQGRLVLTPGEHEADALAGCLAIAMRRASLFGRAPTVHDLTVALSIWGFLTEPPVELAALRRQVFAGVASTHHYSERRALVDGVPADLLKLSPAEVAVVANTDPRRLLAVAKAIGAGAVAGESAPSAG